jgi:hypothetical protein
MCWKIGVVLIALWVLGLVSGQTMGGFVHGVLGIGIVLSILGLIHAQGRA